MPSRRGVECSEEPPAHPGSRAAWAALTATAALAGALVALRDTAWSAVPLALAGVGSTVAVFVGRRRHRPADGRPWIAMALGCGLFVVSAVLRYSLVDTPWAPLAEAVTVSGYVATLLACAGFLRARGAAGQGLHELVDGLIVVASAGACVVVLFTVPTAMHGGTLTVTHLVLGLYPLADVATMFMVLLLSWTSAQRATSSWLLLGAMVGMLTGDLGYAMVARSGALTGSALLDLPFVLGFGAVAAAALHPTMVVLTTSSPWTVHAWSRRRLAVLVPALLLPAALVAVDESRAATLTGAAACAAGILLLLVRAVTATRANSVAQHALRFQATHDPLTGLANRVELVGRLEDLLARVAVDRGHVEVLFLDLDGFKLVNDSWGHDAGDRFLQAAALRLRAVTVPGDVVARTGGDEFVVVLHIAPDDRRDGQALGRRIIAAFRQPLPDDEGSHRSTVSVGLARSTPGCTAEDLLRDGDTAMYRAKADGRNRLVVFDASMHAAVRLRSETELALREAVGRDELRLAYQPVLALDDGRVVGVEALVRWQHPVWGLVSPAAFIPIAEHTGLVLEIGAWVLDAACAQLAAWTTSGVTPPGMTMAVNVSARQLAAGAGLVGLVERTVRRHQVAPADLVLEVTESALMDDAEAAVRVLDDLRSLGVRIAIDDFGTGYSSLAYLQRFPVDRLKIDRSFVAGLGRDLGDGAIVRSVVELSRAFGVEAVAEGVETPEQLVRLRQLGCRYGQGFLWSPGRSATELGSLLLQPWLGATGGAAVAEDLARLGRLTGLPSLQH